MTRDTALRNRDQTRPESAPRRMIGFGVRSPSGLSSPIARWAVSLLALGGAAALVLAAAVLLVVRPRLRAKPLQAGTRI